jgi:hypothetical protein
MARDRESTMPTETTVVLSPLLLMAAGAAKEAKAREEMVE